MKSDLKAIPFIFLLFVANALFSQDDAAANNGIIDARHWQVRDESLALTGYCKYFDNQLLTPAECESALGRPIKFPSLFSPSDNREEGIGYATYVLTVLLPGEEKNLALAIPQIYSSYKLWANGNLIAENGIVGKTEQECKPQWKPQTVAFQVQSDTLTLVMQVANFHHAKGGIKEPMYLGKASLMDFKRSVSVASKLTESAILFLTGIFFLIVFFIRKKNKATLYFSMLSITWATRSVFSNLYLFISFYPDFSWNTMVRIEYIALYLAMIWAILFLSALFQNESNIIIKYGLVFCNVLFAAFSLSASPRVFTQGLTVYLIVSGILLLYGGITVVRAWVNERTGSGILTLSIILGLNIFGYDIFVYEGFSSYDPVIFSVGYICIFILMGLALAAHISLIKSQQSHTTFLTYDDLYKDQK